MSAERAGLPTSAQGQAAGAFKAPLFRAFVERLDAERRFVVLDLGSASAELLDLFSAFRCRIDVAGIDGEAVRALNAAEDGAEALELAESLLPPAHAEPPGFVLCWDLFNYLRKPAMTALMSRVAERIAPGAFAHALIEYSARTMPENPRRLVPLPSLELADRSRAGTARIPAPRYSPEELALALEGFRIDRGVLLTNGMQEFMLRR